MPNTLYSNNGFRSGLWDGEFRHALTRRGYNEACLELKNWSINDSGAVQRRPKLTKRAFTNASWVSGSANYDEEEDALIIPFTSRKRWILTIQRHASLDYRLVIGVFDVDANSWETGLTIDEPATVVFGFNTNVAEYQWAQAGPSIFIATRNVYLPTPPGVLVRIYDDGTGNLEGEVCEFYNELPGLWFNVAGNVELDPVDLGTTSERLISNGGVDPVTVSEGIADGVSNAKNYAPADQVVYDGDFINILGVDYEIDSIAAYNASVPFRITLDFAGAKPDTVTHINSARLTWLSRTQHIRYAAAMAVNFYEGRLIIGNILVPDLLPVSSTLPTIASVLTNITEKKTRMLFSASNDPFFLRPCEISTAVDDDLPIDVNIYSPQVDEILWVAGTRGLFVGGKRGLAAIRPGITPTSLAVEPIDAIGADEITPVAEQSGIIYQSADRNYLVRLVYNFGTGGYDIQYLNGNCQKVVRQVTKLQLGSGGTVAPRCLYAVLEDGTLAVGHIFSEQEREIAWSIFDTELGDIVDCIALDDYVYVVVNDANDKKALFRLDEDDDYVGDNAEAAVKSSGNWKVSDLGNLDTKVVVIGTVTATGEQVHLGLFQTNASGFIRNELDGDNEASVGDDYLIDIYGDIFSAVTVMRPFDSVLTPTLAIPTANEGQAFGSEGRCFKARVGMLDTRQIQVGNHYMVKTAALTTTLTELPQKTGFAKFDGDEHKDEIITTIRGVGAFQATITSLVREVGA